MPPKSPLQHAPTAAARAFALALAASALLHLGVLGWFAQYMAIRQQATQPTRILRFGLLTPPPVAEPEPRPSTTPPRLTDEHVPMDPLQPSTAASTQPAPTQRSAAPAVPAAIDDRPSLQAILRAQLERLATPALPGPGAETERAARLIEGAPVPRLPSPRGWLSGHVGPVDAHIERWRDSDGTVHAELTLPDGTVLCLNRRAPSFDEMMHPWKSTIVTMVQRCGRRRPAEVDYSDPRVPPPPRLRDGD